MPTRDHALALVDMSYPKLLECMFKVEMCRN